jgi:beta-barrel assembly-enhancing protease
MGFPSLFGGRRGKTCDFRLRSFARAVAALCMLTAPFSAVGQTEIPSPQPTEGSQKTRIPTGSNADKYDVGRIGQRGIGRGFNIYSMKREHELGQSLAASFDRGSKLVTDELVNDYVNRVAQKVVRHSDAEVPFIVKVIDSGDVPRAYGLPGGFLYVDSALILATDAEAELAGVIAHEIAHVAARHATRALSRKHMYSIMNSMALLTGPAGIVVEDVAGLAGPLSMKKFARDAEYEADLLGIEYTYAAGYDPEAFVVALEKLHAMEVNRNAVFAKIPGYHLATRLPFHRQLAKSFASYPLTEERVNRLQAEITAFLPGRQDYIIDTNDFQEVKSRLLAALTPVLHRRGPGDDNKGPVLRRSPEMEPQPSSEVRRLRRYTLLPE